MENKTKLSKLIINSKSYQTDTIVIRNEHAEFGNFSATQDEEHYILCVRAPAHQPTSKLARK